jgi:diguanylate cyclase (GGDEF)-like protein
MMYFDVHPFWLIGALTATTCGLLMLAVRNIYPEYHRYVLTLLGVANISLGISYILRLGYPWDGWFFFSVLSDTLIAVCLSLEYWAIRDLKGQRPRLLWMVAAPGIMFVLSAWFTFAHRNLSIENIVFNAINAVMMLMIAWSLSRSENGIHPFPDMVASVAYLLLGSFTASIVVNYLIDRQFSPEYNFSSPRSIFNNIAGILAEAIIIPLFLLMLSDRLNRNLLAQAMSDPLTSLFNRRAFEEIAFREISGTARSGMGVSLLMIDLDRFKQINDRYGHAAGDQVLVTVASTLRRSLRDEDFLCRWGGDEFIALLPRARREQARHSAERILHSLNLPNFVFEGNSIEIAVSIGIATNEDGAVTLPALIAQADAALYQAKKTGRKRFAFAPQENPPLTQLESSAQA